MKFSFFGSAAFQASRASLYKFIAEFLSVAPPFIDKVVKRPNNYGYDVKNRKFVDMLEAGIIDPAKVTCSALMNAASVAGLILTTECLISEDARKEDKGEDV